MIQRVLITVCMLLATPTFAETPSEELTSTLNADCRLLISEFKSELMSEFMAAMKSGGPVHAISVCQTKAPAVAAHFSNLDGWSMRRTALRTRNSSNAPDDFERAAMTVLELDTVTEFSQWITDEDNNTQFRYLSSITMTKPCATCHGDPAKISDSLKNVIAQHYPNDQAVGFEPGQMRGAFSVIVDWPSGKAVADSLWQIAGKSNK